MVDDESIEARQAAVYELFHLHEEDLTRQEIRQAFHTMRGVVLDTILELGDAFGLREFLKFHLGLFETTVTLLRDIEAEELSASN